MIHRRSLSPLSCSGSPCRPGGGAAEGNPAHRRHHHRSRREYGNEWHLDARQAAHQIAEGEGVRALAGGRLVLLTANGNAVRMAQLSQIFVPELAAGAPAGAPLRLILDGGRIWVSVLPLTVTRAPLELEVGPVTVAARSGGIGIRANTDGTVLVRVHHGLGLARASKGTAWERTVKAGEEPLVPASGQPAAARPLVNDPDEAELGEVERGPGRRRLRHARTQVRAGAPTLRAG